MTFALSGTHGGILTDPHDIPPPHVENAVHGEKKKSGGAHQDDATTNRPNPDPSLHPQRHFRVPEDLRSGSMV